MAILLEDFTKERNDMELAFKELQEKSLDVEIDGPVNIINDIKSMVVKIDSEEANELINRFMDNRSYFKYAKVDYEIKYSNDGTIFWTEEKKGTFFAKIKGENASELIKFFGHDKRIVNKYRAFNETDEQEKLCLDNVKSFIKYNKYDEMGRSKYNYDTLGFERKIYKDKEGNSISIKSGMLYKCKCGAYEPINDFEAIICFDMLGTKFKLSSITFDKVTCSVCNEVGDMRYISHVYDTNKFHGIVAKNVFNELEEKGKITLASVKSIRTFYGDKYKSKYISFKIVFNLETGRSYTLPIYNIRTGKRLSPLRQLGHIGFYTAGADLDITLAHFKEIGIAMEQYLLNMDSTNKKALIPFNKYVANYLKVLYTDPELYEQVLDIFNNKVDNETALRNIDGRISSGIILSHDRIGMLTYYCQNPYVDYRTYENIAKAKHSTYYNGQESVKQTKISNTKRVRNVNLLKDLSNKFKVKTRTEKRFINNSNDKASALMYLESVKQNFENQDNINKFLQSATNAFDANYNKPNSFVKLHKNPYLDKLIEEFGETNVANALVKDVKAYNEKYKDSEDKSLMAYNTRWNEMSNNLYLDTIRNYSDIIKVFPEYKLPCDRLRLKELHDKIAMDATKIKHKEKKYVYEDEFMSTYDNVIINNITFRVALSNIILTNIGSQMGICVGGYWNRVEAGELFIVSMIRDNEYIGCLEISKRGELKQAKAKYNRQLSDEDQKVVKIYCEQANIETVTHDIGEKHSVKKDKSKSHLSCKSIPIKITSDTTIEDFLKDIQKTHTPNRVDYFGDINIEGFDLALDEIPF